MHQDLIPILSLFLANAGLIVWFRSESRNDWRHMDAKMDANNQNTQENLKAIRDEIKDFHGRLCAIEERRVAGLKNKSL